MAFYEELVAKGLDELLGMFKDLDANRISGEKKIYSQELASAIFGCGVQGVNILIEWICVANIIQLQAIIFAIGLNKQNDARWLNILTECLKDNRTTIISETIDTLRKLKIRIQFGCVVKYLKHSSPYVRGAAIRYIAAIYDNYSTKILLKALKDPHYIVRENAVDEIERLNIKEAIPYLMPLLQDKYKDVRVATEFALTILTSEGRGTR